MPKIKYLRENIFNEAFEIVKNEGIEMLNARYLAKKLNCSTQPIFSNYENMEEIKKEIIAEANKIYNMYQEDGLKCEKKFYGTGLYYIKFASDFPNLFKLLFMSGNLSSYKNVNIVDKNVENNQNELISKTLNISLERAKYIQLESWVYVHGIASLIATKTVVFDEKIINRLLVDFFKGLREGLKNDWNKKCL